MKEYIPKIAKLIEFLEKGDFIVEDIQVYKLTPYHVRIEIKMDYFRREVEEE